MNTMNDRASVDLATAAIVGLQGLMLRAIREREGDNAAVAYLDRIQGGLAAFSWSVSLDGQGAEIKMGLTSHGATTWLAQVSLSHAEQAPRD